MTTDFRALCVELTDCLEKADWPNRYKQVFQFWVDIARAALAQPEPGSKRRYIYNPAQIAECGGPCQQGPDHCDCGELWITEPELESHQ